MKIHILIGLPGSGKSTWARNQNEQSVVYSSDDYRDIYRLNNPELDEKQLNKLVFETLHKDLFDDIEKYKESYEYILDATNLNRRRRRYLYGELKRKFPESHVISHVFFKSLQQLYDINKVRPERTLPEEVIEKYYFNIQIPRLEVDCDSMEGHGEQFGKSEAFKLEIKSITDGTLQHDCLPHHMESVREHIRMCIVNSNNYMLKFISFFHDLGKAVSKKISDDGRARYIGHANVSAYYCLSFCLLNKEAALSLDGLMACEIIYNHMLAHQGMGIKNIKNNKLDDELLYYLAEFAAIDSKSRITAYEEEDKMAKKYYALQYQTPDEIKNHGIYQSPEDALDAIYAWWRLNDFKPSYTRILGENDLVVDYGLYSCFYLIKEINKENFEDRMFHNVTTFNGRGMPK